MARKKKKPSKKKTRKPKKKSSGLSCLTIASIVLLFVVVLAGALSAVLVVGVLKFLNDLPPMMEGPLPSQRKTTKIFAANGELLANLYYIENREYARLHEIPESLQLSVIAIEDERFFLHPGIDMVGIARAMFVNLRSGDIREGASTITQQLVKNTYLTPERTMERKMKEMQYALALERKYSKQEILEFYLNQINFGHGAYGVRTAARTYFNKQLKDITLAEAALLASVPKAPSRYSPYLNMARSLERRNMVLARMYRLGFISNAQYEAAIREDIKLAPLTGPGYENYRAPNFVTHVIDLLTEPKPSGRYGFSSQHLHTQGLRIYTTLDFEMQKIAEETIMHGMKLGKDMNANMTQAAIVAMEPQTGKIRAMVGGVDFKKTKFNRATQALRQPGSAFKPFVYLTAINQGYSMESKLVDEKICFPNIPEKYCPNNYDHTYKGLMTFRTALVLSRNIPAVKVCSLVGPRNVAETARSMGIKSDLRAHLSLGLGTSEVTVLDMADAYSVIANGGYRVEPVAITRVTNDSGTVLDENKAELGERVLDDNAIARIVPVMIGIITGGTGTRANIGRPAAGKTGTTSDYRDAWFVGFTPQLVTAVWVGNDDNSPLRGMRNGKPVGRGIAGGTIPAPMWKYFMERALKGKEVREFNLPVLGPAKTAILQDTATGTEYIGIGSPADYIEPEILRFDEETTEEDNAYDELEFIEPEEQPVLEELF